MPKGVISSGAQQLERMMKAILAKKIYSTRIFDKAGIQMPVTVLKPEKNFVSQIKTSEKDGYRAIQVAAGTKRKVTKPMTGHLKKAKIEVLARKLYEIKNNDVLNLGDELTLDQFKEGERANVTAVSKGKGFAGTVKRHGFHLGPKTHGSNNYRQPGSIGATFPERVIKGRRMAGHMGHDKVTVKNLIVVKVDKDKILIKGAVPGPKNADVLIWSNQ